jgi:hypothetical protein
MRSNFARSLSTLVLDNYEAQSAVLASGGDSSISEDVPAEPDTHSLLSTLLRRFVHGMSNMT